MQTTEYFLKYNGWKYLLTLTCLYVLATFAINYLFLSDELFYHSYEEQLAVDRIAKMISLSQKWQWVGYIFIPILVLIRISFASICLYIGFLFMELRTSFTKLFKVALLADFVFLIAAISKLVILIFFKEVSVLTDLQFQPLSLMELFDRTSVDTLFIYPLTLINVFELLYWLVLAWLLTKIFEKPFGRSFKLVASSYGIGLLFWVVFVMFITITLSR